MLESFAHGVPCVMSEIASRGIDFLSDDLTWLIARSPEEFAIKIAVLHNDDARVTALSERCRAYIIEHNNSEEVTDRIRAAIHRAEGR